MILILLIILICFLIYKYKNYFDKEYVTVNIYDETHMLFFTYYVKNNLQYYNVCVDTNYGDKNINLTKQVGVYTRNFNSRHFNNTTDVYTDIGQKIIFNDKNLNIEGYYTFETSITEDNNKNKISVKYIKMNILKKGEKVDLKIMFDKIYSVQVNNLYLSFVDYHTRSCCKYNNDNAFVKSYVFYQGKKEGIITDKIMKPFFHKDSDMLWSVVKNTFLNPNFSENSSPKCRLLLHGPSGNGKSSFIYRLAMCTHKSIGIIDFYLTKSNIYRFLGNRIILMENIENTLKEIHIRELKKYSNFTVNDLFDIIKNPFISKVIIATTTKYDELITTFPKFIGPGKFKPIHFGYITSDTLQDISMYFFENKIKGRISEVIMIPTAEIIDLAFEALTVSEKPFNYFSDKLFKLMT